MDSIEKKARARAEMIFRNKQEQQKDAPIATADYKADQEKTLQNMVRLRKLRLTQPTSECLHKIRRIEPRMRAVLNAEPGNVPDTQGCT